MHVSIRRMERGWRLAALAFVLDVRADELELELVEALDFADPTSLYVEAALSRIERLRAAVARALAVSEALRGHYDPDGAVDRELLARVLHV